MWIKVRGTRQPDTDDPRPFARDGDADDTAPRRRLPLAVAGAVVAVALFVKSLMPQRAEAAQPAPPHGTGDEGAVAALPPAATAPPPEPARAPDPPAPARPDAAPPLRGAEVTLFGPGAPDPVIRDPGQFALPRSANHNGFVDLDAAAFLTEAARVAGTGPRDSFTFPEPPGPPPPAPPPAEPENADCGCTGSGRAAPAQGPGPAPGVEAALAALMLGSGAETGPEGTEAGAPADAGAAPEGFTASEAAAGGPGDDHPLPGAGTAALRGGGGGDSFLFRLPEPQAFAPTEPAPADPRPLTIAGGPAERAQDDPGAGFARIYGTDPDDTPPLRLPQMAAAEQDRAAIAAPPDTEAAFPIPAVAEGPRMFLALDHA
ncbi:hypothetical protein [Ruixingdingia sedimenti]|uniref:Meckel syndrome type 1 protein n=1 Tax=Ruixingdingia sedimenti TaxID=3073604 RepID=A0ABU1F5V7_9RHOB|nr:hypothetical protein [Xinfangfangia sp. LG-4]MDR5652255.1 hypothetical protein [Xinfangfangia sp. LG-4]